MGKKLGGLKPAILTGGLSIPMKKLGLSLEDEQGEYATPEEAYKRALQRESADYAKGMAEAEKGVQESAFTKGIFGQGGMQERIGKEELDLANRGFQLSQEDREAYGQASGDISRLFGQQEQQATQNLARRGLASAGSGAAGAVFSGLAGNKNEQLGKMQMQIANQRMENTRQRLFQNRQMQQDLANQGANMAAARRQDKLAGLAGAAGVESQIYNEKRNMLADKEAAVRPGLFSTIGQGLQAGIGNLATQAPGMLATGGVPIGGGGGGMGSSAASYQRGLPQDRAGGTTSLSRDYLSMK